MGIMTFVFGNCYKGWSRDAHKRSTGFMAHHKILDKWLQFHCHFIIKGPSCCLPGSLCNQIIPLLNRTGKSPTFQNTMWALGSRSPTMSSTASNAPGESAQFTTWLCSKTLLGSYLFGTQHIFSHRKNAIKVVVGFPGHWKYPLGGQSSRKLAYLQCKRVESNAVAFLVTGRNWKLRKLCNT